MTELTGHVCEPAYETSAGPDHHGVLILTPWCECGLPLDVVIDSVI